MSIEMLPARSTALPVGRRIAALGAVGAASVLVRLPPGRLKSVLEFAGRGARPARAGQAADARQAVVSVSERCAGNQGCLHRSVAAVLLCRMTGRVPDWSTGIRVNPFRAHAWVAVEGVPIGEGADIDQYIPMLTVQAPRRTHAEKGARRPRAEAAPRRTQAEKEARR